MTIVLDGTKGETPASWTTAGRPASPSAGQWGFNTTTGNPEWWSPSTSSWASPTAFLAQSMSVTSSTTLTANDSNKLVVIDSSMPLNSFIQLPSVSNIVVFGISNNSSISVSIKSASGLAFQPSGMTDSVLIPANSSMIISSNGTQWITFAVNLLAAFRFTQFTTSGIFTATSGIPFLVCVGGSTCGVGINSTTAEKTAAAGGSYGESFVASPSGTYTVTIGAGGALGQGNLGGTTSFVGTGVDISVTSADVGTTKGVVTGATFSAVGGNGAEPSAGGAGGGGGGGRAGDGGNGAVGGSTWGAGGGTGGNNASGQTIGIAATSTSASAYPLNNSISSSTFLPGNTGLTVRGGHGANGSNTVILKGTSSTTTIYGGAAGLGAFFSTSTSRTAGNAGAITVIEFL